MRNDRSKPKSEADSELEREIRAGRAFSLAEAIGRLAGPGIMKGVSPVTRKDQAAAEIHEYVHLHLADSAGVLADLLVRQVAESEQLLKAPDQPLNILAGHVRRVLGSEYGLGELVREADMEWGRMLGERPYFECDGSPPSPDDPYTIESVRSALTRLSEGLAAREA